MVMATFCADIQWLASLFPKASAEKGPTITFICLEETNLRAVSTSYLILPLVADKYMIQGVHSPLHPDMPNWVRLVVPRKGLTEYTTMHMSESVNRYSRRVHLLNSACRIHDAVL